MDLEEFQEPAAVCPKPTLHSTDSIYNSTFLSIYQLLSSSFSSLQHTLSNMDSNFHGMTATYTRRTAFVEEDEGLASLAEMEAGFSGKNFSMSSRRRGSYKAFPRSSASSHSSSRSGLAYEETQYFLDSCHLCKKPLGGNRDIFMYRGNTPFCSEECRQEQMDIDEAKEKNWNLSLKVASRKEQQQQSNSKGKNKDFRVRTGTVVAG